LAAALTATYLLLFAFPGVWWGFERLPRVLDAVLDYFFHAGRYLMEVPVPVLQPLGLAGLGHFSRPTVAGTCLLAACYAAIAYGVTQGACDLWARYAPADPQRRRAAKIVLQAAAAVALGSVARSAWTELHPPACRTMWLDADLQTMKGPLDTCTAALKRVGGKGYARIGADVYEVTTTDPTFWSFVRLVGPVDPEKLQSYIDVYVGDGKAIFYGRERVASLSPPLAPANLRAVPATSWTHYVTDGRWVLFEGQPVQGADAATFRQVDILRTDGSVECPMMAYAHDRRTVYRDAQRVEGAEAASFEVLSYAGQTPPRGIDAIWVAFDRMHAWAAAPGGVTRPLQVTAAQLKALHADLRRATKRASSKRCGT
jgi:hypothetical protein